MKFNRIIFLAFFILLVSGCSSSGGDTNKANLNEEMFDEGKQVVKLYAQQYNGEDVGSELSDSVESFLSSYADNYSSENEEYFVSSIELLKAKYEVYIIKQAIGEGEGTKEEIKELLLRFKDEFGISLE